VARYARRLLAINDQILLQAGAAAEAHGARIGICAALAPDMLSPLFSALHRTKRGDVVQIEHACAAGLSQRLANGYLDIAVLPATPQTAATALVRWSEPLAWLCAPDFLLSPGKPIPLIGAVGDTAHGVALAALDAAGQMFALTVAAEDWTARLAALRAGFGYVVAPERTAETLIDGRPLKIAREHYLPRLPDLMLGIFTRPDLGISRDDALIAALAGVLQRDAPDAVGEPRSDVIAPRRRNCARHDRSDAVQETF
jgi:DNA-binding transcriptional LysR family regulator